MAAQMPSIQQPERDNSDTQHRCRRRLSVAINPETTQRALFSKPYIQGTLCGDGGHPIMAGDLSEDSQVNLIDFGELSAGWMDIYSFPNLVDMATNWMACNHPVSCP